MGSSAAAAAGEGAQADEASESEAQPELQTGEAACLAGHLQGEAEETGASTSSPAVTDDQGQDTAARLAASVSEEPQVSFAPGDAVRVRFRVDGAHQYFDGRVQKRSTQHELAYVVLFEDGETWTVDPRTDNMMLMQAANAEHAAAPAPRKKPRRVADE